MKQVKLLLGRRSVEKSFSEKMVFELCPVVKSSNSWELHNIKKGIIIKELTAQDCSNLLH